MRHCLTMEFLGLAVPYGRWMMGGLTMVGGRGMGTPKAGLTSGCEAEARAEVAGRQVAVDLGPNGSVCLCWFSLNLISLGQSAR